MAERPLSEQRLFVFGAKSSRKPFEGRAGEDFRILQVAICGDEVVGGERFA